MDIFHMSDIIPLIGLPYPPYGRSNYNVPCPCCDDEPHAKHLNINLQKNVFRCPRCGFSGGIFDLYAYYTGIAREEVRDALIARLDVQGSIPKPEHIPVPVVAEVPPTDIASRSDTYTGLLSKLTLASDHRQNLRTRGLSDEEIDRLGYRWWGCKPLQGSFNPADIICPVFPAFTEKTGNGPLPVRAAVF